MSEQELVNRINMIQQQIFLSQKYTEDFEKIIGKRGLEKFVDNALDELFSLRKELIKIRNKNN